MCVYVPPGSIREAKERDLVRSAHSPDREPRTARQATEQKSGLTLGPPPPLSPSLLPSSPQFLQNLQPVSSRSDGIHTHPRGLRMCQCPMGKKKRSHPLRSTLARLGKKKWIHRGEVGGCVWDGAEEVEQRCVEPCQNSANSNIRGDLYQRETPLHPPLVACYPLRQLIGWTLRVGGFSRAASTSLDAGSVISNSSSSRSKSRSTRVAAAAEAAAMQPAGPSRSTQ